MVYHTEEGLRSHLYDSHPNMNDEQIEDHVSLTETTVADDRKTFPFCGIDGPFPRGPYNHMAFHQEKLALFSLPLNLNEEYENDVGSGHALGIRSVESSDASSLRFSDISHSSEDESNGSDGDFAMMEEFKAAIMLSTASLPEVDDFETGTQDANYDEALQIASSEGEREAIRALLTKGANINASSEEYGSGLYAASSEGQGPIVTLLLEHGANVNAVGGKHGSALQAACSRGYRDVAEVLLLHGAEVNAQSGRASNALAAAASGGYAKLVELLLAHQADVHALSTEFGNVLGAAVHGGSITIVEHLLNHGADIDHSIDPYVTAFCAAIIKNELEIAEYFLNVDQIFIKRVGISTMPSERLLSQATDKGSNRCSLWTLTFMSGGIFSPTRSQMQVQVATKKLLSFCSSTAPMYTKREDFTAVRLALLRLMGKTR